MTADEAQHIAFIDEQRGWLREHKAKTGMSWPELSAAIGFPSSTLSNFGGKGYQGKELPLAEAVKRYHDDLLARASAFIDAPEVPGYFETQTSLEIINLLHWTKRNRMVYAALGSGLGKTVAAKHFASLYPHVYIATVRQSESSSRPLQKKVLRALGVSNASGESAQLSEMIVDKLATMHRPVLIIDEAQHLSVKAIEEIRSWHDDTGAGIAFFGDERLYGILNNGSGKNALPQIRRRIKSIPPRTLPYVQDVHALAAAWGIAGDRLTNELKRIAQHPGGLGRATFILEDAGLLAASEQKAIELGHLQEAAAAYSQRGIA